MHGSPAHFHLALPKVCGLARAGSQAFVDLTLYVPMRDGVSESNMVGLFADWREWDHTASKIGRRDPTTSMDESPRYG